MKQVIYTEDGTLLRELIALSADQPLWAEVTGKARCSALSRLSVPWRVSGSLMHTAWGRARLFCERAI